MDRLKQLVQEQLELLSNEELLKVLKVPVVETAENVANVEPERKFVEKRASSIKNLNIPFGFCVCKCRMRGCMMLAWAHAHLHIKSE